METGVDGGRYFCVCGSSVTSKNDVGAQLLLKHASPRWPGEKEVKIVIWSFLVVLRRKRNMRDGLLGAEKFVQCQKFGVKRASYCY